MSCECQHSDQGIGNAKTHYFRAKQILPKSLFPSNVIVYLGHRYTWIYSKEIFVAIYNVDKRNASKGQVASVGLST